MQTAEMVGQGTLPICFVLAELPQALSDQWLELGVVQQAVEMLELLPTQLQLLSPQVDMS
jgi:hypothetical protein